MRSRRPRYAVLISGRGSNLAAIIGKREEIGGTLVGVFANNSSAPGLDHARRAGVPVAALSHRDHPDREDFDLRVIELLDRWATEWVVLAGYMRILSDTFINRFAGTIVNIHPSLLPAFPGLRPYEQALERGAKVSGATVHLVSLGEVDTGPIVAQRVVPVLPGDDPDLLAARILAVEHELYPESLRRLFSGELVLRDTRVEERSDTNSSPQR